MLSIGKSFHFIKLAKIAAARSPKIGPRVPLELQ